MDLAYRPVYELARLIRGGELRSETLLETLLARIERYNPGLNALVQLDADGARQQARAADAATARGESWGALHGVPMTVKDTFEVAGMITTAGAPALRNHDPDGDAVVVSRLKAAGAIVFGKSNVPLYAGDLQTYNAVYGTTNNPWDPARTPGGSSGGSSAALAGGLTPLEIGSDIGGSIRTPASFCGVCGHKTSYRIVPSYGHIPGPPGSLLAPDIAVMGPLARCVDDLELALDIVAGPEPDTATAWRLELPAARHKRLKDFRVAAWLDDAVCPVDTQIGELLTDVVARLRDAGTRVDETARPEHVDLASARTLFYNLLSAAVGAELPQGAFERMTEVAADAGDQATDYASLFAQGATQRHAEWQRNHEKRLQLRRHWARFFERYDVLLCPVTHTLPFPHDQSLPIDERRLSVNGRETPYMDIISWVGLTGLVYLPVTVVPIGRTAAGLPVGMQIAGPYLEDRTTLQFAREVEALLGGFQPPPGF